MKSLDCLFSSQERMTTLRKAEAELEMTKQEVAAHK